jgi:hypothetical protein
VLDQGEATDLFVLETLSLLQSAVDYNRLALFRRHHYSFGSEKELTSLSVIIWVLPLNLNLEEQLRAVGHLQVHSKHIHGIHRNQDC